MLDNEDELAKMCSTCQAKSKENKCISCGKKKELEEDRNPNFDDSKFEELKKRASR